MVEIRWGSWCFRECRYERKLWGIFKRLTCRPASHPALHVLDLLAGSYSWKSKIQIRIFPLRLTVSRKIYCSRLFGLETLLLPLHSLDCIVSFIMVAAFYRDYTWLLLWKMLLFYLVRYVLLGKILLTLRLLYPIPKPTSLSLHVGCFSGYKAAICYLLCQVGLKGTSVFLQLLVRLAQECGVKELSWSSVKPFVWQIWPTKIFTFDFLKKIIFLFPNICLMYRGGIAYNLFIAA